MARYIELDALVAEIEKIIADETESIKSFEHGRNVSEVQRSNARIGVLMHIRSLLNTLEVKEMDLQEEPQVKESMKFQHVDKMCEESGNSLTQEPVSEVLEEEIEKCLKRHNMLAVGKKDFTDIAKHFANWQKERIAKRDKTLNYYTFENGEKHFAQHILKMIANGWHMEAVKSTCKDKIMEKYNYEQGREIHP